MNHKGSHGKVSVIGGNKDFTGAPYFSAFSAMQAGADYGNVLCTGGAATAIKSYAPELIVIPCMLQEHDLPDGEIQVRQHRFVLACASAVSSALHSVAATRKRSAITNCEQLRRLAACLHIADTSVHNAAWRRFRI